VQVMAIDLETTVRDGKRASPYVDEILAIAVNTGTDVHLTQDLEWLERVLEDSDIVKVFHNGAFDLQFLMHHMFDVSVVNVWDTMIVERMLTAGTNLSCDLGSVVDRRCGVRLSKDIRKSFMQHSGELSLQQRQYALNDVRHLLQVHAGQKEQVSARGMDDIVRIENELVPIIAEMELCGIGFDPAAWDEILAEEEARLPELEAEAQRQLSASFEFDIFAGQFVGTVNLNSHTQLLSAFRAKGYELTSTSEDDLRHLGGPAVEAVLAYRECAGFLKWDYPKYVNPVTQRIHPDFVQTGADTGRFSCKNPNLQNVPKEARFRRMFVARSEHQLITADYAQQELRVLAELSGDRNLLEACRQSDVHLANARLIFDDDTIGKDDPRRNTAKNTGFALAYGAGLKTFAASAGLSMSDAKSAYEQIKKLYPEALTWGRDAWVRLRQVGYTSTIGGRRRYFPGVADAPGKYTTVARNSPVQGTSADMVKLAMVLIHDRIREFNARLVLCVHDEIVVEAAVGQAKEVACVVEQAMKDAGAYFVKAIPVPAKAVIADTWTK